MPRNSRNDSLASYNEAKKLFDDYRKAKRSHLISFPIFNYEENKIIKRTENILLRMRDQHKFILENTFIKENSLYWWLDYFNQTKFYRLRGQAIEAFLIAYRNSLWN